MKRIVENINFGNEAGDDLLPEEIESFFVEQDSFREYLDFDNRILLSIARKGVGKSALIRWMHLKLENDDDFVVITLRGRDLVRANFELGPEPSSANELINDWMARICCVINREIAKSMKLALSDDAISVVEAAEIDGFKRRNILSALTDRLQNLIPRTERERIRSGSDIETLKRLKRQKVCILVDDLDATYQRTEKENLELSTFFSACRYLCTEVGGIAFRVTMRTDVWPMIRRYDEALDKMDQYVRELVWSESDFRRLLYRRVQYQAEKHGISIPPRPDTASMEEEEEYYISLVFEKRMQWAESERRTYKILYTLSYHRPRWAIQLCKLAQKEALSSKSDLITKAHIDEVWGPYGKRRIADLVVEHKHQCSTVEELTNGFRGAERRMNRHQLIDWIKRHITNHATPVIEGRSVKIPIEIANFLFRIGFLQARIETDEGYEHYSFADLPDALSSRTNDDFGAIWEIHPCYREALDIQKLNRWQGRQRNLGR